MTLQEKTQKHNKEVEKNYAYFKKLLPELMKQHKGQYALLYKQEIVDYFDDKFDAVREGKKRYRSRSGFSIQEVTDKIRYATCRII